MKQHTLMFLAIISSTSAQAKVTEADLDRNIAWAARQNPSVSQSVIDNQWERYNKPPNVGGAGGVISGGEYLKRGSACYTQNQLTGGCYCPSGFKTNKFINVNGEGGVNLYYCWK